MIAEMSLYQICMYFLIYSFIGWILEVTYHAVALGKIVNRGFLNGPVCPVYGFGMLVVLSMADYFPVNEVADYSLGLLFLGGMVLATLVELIAGWILDKSFHARWWDYSDKPFNFHGYICLEFSILWGIGVVVAVRLVHPLIRIGSTEKIPENIGWILMAVFYAFYILDFIVTAATIRGLNKKLEELDAIRARMRVPSDKMSQVIATGTIRTNEIIGEGKTRIVQAGTELKDQSLEKIEEAQLKAHAARRQLSEQAQKARNKVTAQTSLAKNGIIRYARSTKEFFSAADAEKAEQLLRSIIGNAHFGAGRFIKAFPNLKHRDFPELLDEIKDMIGRN